ncbi:hypothetical protein [Paludisphaera borealis]|uniref:Glycoside hydrolase family 5 domain-containing protein n=1 Tax=Paludisphaera borealis TaxID=1387353 RepID=A0A1U7CP43_9BACT|nr:hypothetical protein [Paludisphaera borealis]APW60676.1 hypothetical protein BSF38_02163 [Paludisphaera borealis]
MPVFAVVLSMLLTGSLPPLRLHPANERYFEFRGKPTVLVTSGEHYGAVLNLDFDYVRYLDELQSRGFNLTRTFSGTYRETPGSFKIEHNTLAPKPGRYASPWIEKGGKYDLDAFDDAYFRRLKSFMAEASKRGVVVEYVLFCPFYEDGLWTVSPMNAQNNVNRIGDCPREEVFTLKHLKLVDRQLAFVRRAVAELNAFDNLYFEICNEPYFGGVTLDWQKKVAETIAAVEKGLPNTHLIAQNIANGSAKIDKPDPNVSIFNFHYASPPDAIRENRGLSRPIGFDETGFKGTADAVYRREAWEFLLSGGAVFSHLDYSFTIDHPDGTAKIVDPTPGGGGPEFRRQLSILKKLIDGLDLTKTRPINARLASRDGGARPVIGLVDTGKPLYAFYASAGPRAKFSFMLPPKAYKIEWIEPATGAVVKTERVDVLDAGAETVMESPEYRDDVALRISVDAG